MAKINLIPYYNEENKLDSITVPVMLDMEDGDKGRKIGQMVLDTGSNRTIIFKHYADTLGLQGEDTSIHINSLSVKKVGVQKLVVPAFYVGGVVRDDFEVLIVDHIVPKPFMGLLGLDYLTSGYKLAGTSGENLFIITSRHLTLSKRRYKIG